MVLLLLWSRGRAEDSNVLSGRRWHMTITALSFMTQIIIILTAFRLCINWISNIDADDENNGQTSNRNGRYHDLTALTN